MALDAKSVQKPFRKLGRLLKSLTGPPSSEDVHDIRTHTRRVEAIVDAFELKRKKAGNGLVKSLRPIRKAAGAVRDMDVLSGFVAELDPREDDDCRAQLMEHLANQRTKAAKKLLKEISANKKKARAELKECGKMADSGLDASGSRDSQEKDKQKSRRQSTTSIATSLQIEQELINWPKLTEGNIHSFRLKVKELRYVLELADNSDSPLIEALGEVKDQIGLWHDWSELSGIASEVLDHGAGCSISAQMRARTRQEFQKAVVGANHLREAYLTAEPGHAARKKGVIKGIHPAAVEAASRLAS